MLFAPLVLVSLAVAPDAASRPAVAALVRAAGPGATVSTTIEGQVRLLRLAAPATSGLAHAAQVDALLARHGAAFGIADPALELRLEGATPDARGGSRLSYDQLAAGVVVHGGGLRAHFDARGSLRVVQARVVPVSLTDAAPRLTAGEAALRAEARAARVGVSEPVSSTVTGPFAFVTDLARGTPGTSHLAFRVEVRAPAYRAFHFVDAVTGKIVEIRPGIADAIQRTVYDGSLTGAVLWDEGGALPSGRGAEVDELVYATGKTYAFYETLTGGATLSYDGHDARMQSVWNLQVADGQESPCPNAYWDGTSTNFCLGVVSDSTVAHEWTHAYTEYTDNLVYMWQPGALDEAYSDIFGVTVELLASGEASDAQPRVAGQCSALTGGAPAQVVVTAPAAAAGTYPAGFASFGPRLAAVLPLSGTLVLADDGAGDTADACEPIVNGAALSGNIALVRRGTCNFTDKVKRAQDVGAIAAVVFNNKVDTLAGLGGADLDVVIPSVLLPLDVGTTLAGVTGAAVTLALDLAAYQTAYSDPSSRWLLGRHDAAFPVAARDLWNPACLEAPGKVSDATYRCGTSDSGGVHANSTVASHAYALLVDGGAFNGQTIRALGLDKAAAVYWRAKHYQDSLTDFAGHADALDSACTDLVGQTVPVLAAGGTSAGPVTTDDCAQVKAATAAVELRDAPSQCAFEPLLAPGAPALCAGAPVFSDDVESGAGGWTVAHAGLKASFTARDWVRATTLPAGRGGTAWFATDPNTGDCQGDNQAGTITLTSPVMKVPKDAIGVQLGFTHYVATEADIDGGVLRVRVNGGAFQPVPVAAFTFNGYNSTLLTNADGNDDPLAGSYAFSGTDGGKVVGSWGDTRVSLGSLAKPGDTVQLQLVFGTDGCGGFNGWYVDDVKVVACGATASSGGGGGCAGVPGSGAAVALIAALLGVASRRRRRG